MAKKKRKKRKGGSNGNKIPLEILRKRLVKLSRVIQSRTS